MLDHQPEGVDTPLLQGYVWVEVGGGHGMCGRRIWRCARSKYGVRRQQKMPSLSEIDDAAQRQFISLGLQYYALGREGARSLQLIPVSGNLLHHAVEMALKALLVRVLHLDGLKGLRHNLEALWERATATHPPINSDRRCETITELHRFESLRYPERVIAEGAVMRLSLFAPPPERGDTTVPWYDLVLEDVDELFQAIFRETGLNPPFFLARFNDKAMAALREQNRWPIE